jgi:hypothetical protein
MKSPVKPIPYEDKYLDRTLSFLGEFSPDHPELSDKDLFLWQRCKRYLTLFGGEITGHMAVIIHKFMYNKTEINIGWGATLVLDMSDFAMKTFAGTALLDQCMNDRSYIYAGVGIVPEIESSYKRRGYVICRESVRMYARFFNIKKALGYYCKPENFAFPIKLMNLIKPAAKNRSINGHIEKVQEFNPDLDDIWGRLLSWRYELYGERTAQFLNYKIRQPHKTYQAFIHKDLQGAVDGYIIYRLARNRLKELSIIKVCDLVGSDYARAALLARAMEYARESKVDGIVSLGSARDMGSYKRQGLWLSRPLPVGVRPEFKGKMHLSFFDSDLDNLW